MPFEAGGQVDTIFTDFKEAFDLVDHGILISTLEALGFGNPILSWLTPYLTSREQFFTVHNATSDLPIPTSGIP